jgi:hypothetical protein
MEQLCTLCDFSWRENGVVHEVTIVEDGAVLQIGTRYFHMRNKEPVKHPAILYKDPDGNHLHGVAVDASLGGHVNTEDEGAVVLSGIGKIRLGKEIVHVLSDDTLSINGTQYTAGDKVMIGGREATLSLAEKLQQKFI